MAILIFFYGTEPLNTNLRNLVTQFTVLLLVRFEVSVFLLLCDVLIVLYNISTCLAAKQDFYIKVA